MASKLNLKKKKNETLNGLDDVSMDGPDSLLFINFGDIFAESTFIYLFIYLFGLRFTVNYFAIRARLLTSRLRAEPPLKNRSSERKALLEGWSSKPLFNLFVDAYWSNIVELPHAKVI